MKKNENKNICAFTLAEVMIVLAVIGILVAILLPTAQNLTPDKAILKFKKGNIGLTSAIRDLVNSDKYFYDGDLGLDRDGNRIESAKYFCNALGDVLTTKKVECSEDNLGYNSTAVANLADIETDEIDGIKIYEYVDCMCKKNTTSGAEIVLNDDTIIYTVNPYYHFGSLTESGAGEEKRLFNLCSDTKRYKYICMDIDGFDNGEDPFGYALRADGKIIYGARAQAWISKDINNEEEIIVATTDSCEASALAITPEEDVCKIDEKTPAPTPEPEEPAGCGELAMKITAGGKDICMMKFNAGDDALNFGMNNGAVFALPATITNVMASGSSSCTPSETKFCCWSGDTISSCDAANGIYDGCTRTVCDWRAATEFCSKLTYLGKSWRLPTNNELTSIGTQLSNISIGKGSEGLMLCDDISGKSSARCASSGSCGNSYNDNCYPRSLWSSEEPRVENAYHYYLSNGTWHGPYETSKEQAYSVRCVSDLL